MRYLRFVIHNYRAIIGPLEVNVDRRSLTPIIGVNESGKTTILQALFAFDYFNDEFNEEGRHLRDTSNLYQTTSPAAIIQADIYAIRKDLLEALSDMEQTTPTRRTQIEALKKKTKLPDKLIVTRNLETLNYDVSPRLFPTGELNHELAKEIVARCPYILYFDDFRDKVDDRIEIDETEKESPTGWLGILERLFKSTDKNLSLFDLPKLEERQRKSVLSKVKRYLNSTLTEEWQNFRLDERDALEISIDLVSEPGPGSSARNYLRLLVVERDSKGDEHFFFISDRSKGFFWFFNFVMKLEFNPKVQTEGTRDTIYLLDEPGSYLHASAQSKLCSKLRSLSERNRVIYCTHSHYLLNPEIIPLASIAVADKDANGNIRLVSIFQYEGTGSEQRLAFQPVLDALQIKPFMLDMTHQRIVVTEGIYDFFAIDLFKQGRQFGVLPSVGAESIKTYVSFLIAWQVQFRVIWDNDDAGRKAYADAEGFFGDVIARQSFRVLPKPGNQKSRILQDLFRGEDMVMLRQELELPEQTSFEKTMAAWYYSPRRNELLGKMSTGTKVNFEAVFESLQLM